MPNSNPPLRNFNHRRVLFDTNILIDCVDKNRKDCEAARKSLRHCNGGADIGVVSPSSLNDAYYILRKQHGEKWARNAIKYLLELIVVLPFGPEECIISSESNEPDFEDGMIRAAAELNDVEYILTNDAKAFKRSRIRSITCEEYLDIVESENELKDDVPSWGEDEPIAQHMRA